MQEESIEVAACVVLDEFGRILLLHRNFDDYGHWELPGGKVEQEEAPEAAAVREMGEELGIVVRLTRPLSNEIFEDGETTYRFHWFMADIVQGEPTIMEPELFDDVYFMDLDDVMSLSLSTGMQLLLEKIWTGEVVLEP